MTEEIEKISEEEVFDVVKMALDIYNGSMFGYYNPFMSNQNLNDLNNDPSVPTKVSVEEALKNYKNRAKELQSYSEFAEVYDRIYGRAIEHYTYMLSFDLDPVCINCKDPKEYLSKTYLEDKKRVYKFLDNFDYKAEFKKAVKNMLSREVYFTWLRDSQGTFNDNETDVSDDPSKIKKLPKYTLQTMPQNRCLISGQWEYGLLYDFDMTYFTRGGVDINQYDPAFKKYFINIFGDKNKVNYDPTAQLGSRDGTFAQYTQTSPKDGAWVFKFDMTNMNTTPFLSSMLRNVLTDEEVFRLQTDANILGAKAILAGELIMNDNKNNQDKDNTAFKLETFKKFMKLVAMGLDKSISSVALPAKDVDFYQYENKNKDMYDNQLKTTAGIGASASRLLYSSDKMSQEEIRLAVEADCNLIGSVYPQFQNFLKYYVNKKTKKYKFDFIFSGFEHGFIKERERDTLLKLADVGIVLHPTAYAKLVGMTPQAFERSLEEGHHGKLTQLLTPLISIHTASGTNDKGRPEKGENEISDNGSVSRDYD